MTTNDTEQYEQQQIAEHFQTQRELRRNRFEEMKRMSKVYLGDSVYAEWDGQGITLTTEDGVMATNNIYLEPEVFSALVEYADSTEEEKLNLEG